MDPLNKLQVAIKNNIDVFYFSCAEPYKSCLLKMCRWMLLSQKSLLTTSSLFAKRTVEGQDMLYQSVKFTNGIWVLAELKMQPGNPAAQLSLKTRAIDIVVGVQATYKTILHN
ncbi:PREDICTED: AP-1 complex subunit beta-1-like [Acropora digitifera]|uniref:AP-1 complex subunit beta-1-like n=1 Tax=Acropora digitifera TaxID=70779 RepID=UPI00077A1C5F|nr:PREDICTED: AP-1 complex subunit beta-1-like [Acropora digitifera]